MTRLNSTGELQKPDQNIGSSVIAAAFPNLANLPLILEVILVTTAIVEHTLSSMKLIKTRLRSRIGKNILEHTMHICIKGPDHLSNDILEAVMDHYYKRAKKCKLPL